MQLSDPVHRYRSEVDGLRSIAVLAVIFFHFGILKYGYLGVDVFFVISGFLITTIICRECSVGKFSLLEFYTRRTRRIIPLVLFVSMISLLISYFVMLPDDLENMAQSVVATNIFSNNILQAITTKNYWDVVNEYKPLMHTWSLGVEEQFYIIYPLIFIFLASSAWRLIVIVLLAALSFSLFLVPFPEHLKFYLLPFRFFELAVGGIAAMCLNGRLITHKAPAIFFIVLAVLLIVPFEIVSANFMLSLVVGFTAVMLCSDLDNSKYLKLVLSNPVSVYIGKISFSLYMWHQVVLAIYRYTVSDHLSGYIIVLLTGIMFGLSHLSYKYIEQPFRNKETVSARALWFSVVPFALVLTVFSLYVYDRGGVVRDVPELDVYYGESARGMHASYNHRIHQYKFPWKDGGSKVLVVGNSFARDWANVLIESIVAENIEIVYLEGFDNPNLDTYAQIADHIFFSPITKEDFDELNLGVKNIWVVGVKNFGTSSGIYYNRRDTERCLARAPVESSIGEKNALLESHWGNHYLNYVSLLGDTRDAMPIFTPECKFISQDTRHLTKAGAVYMATIFEKKISEIFLSP